MVNSRESLAKIPSMNNDANPYIITLDIYKEGYWAYDISNYYKGRVDDNGTPFMVRWFEHGQLKNVQGLRPFIRGTVGQHTVDDQTDPDNPKVVPGPDCSQIDQTGETTDTAPGGIAIYRMVNTCFTQEGMFYGEIGLKDSSGLVLSSVDIAFKVLGGRMNMIGARKFYVSEFEKALADFEDQIRKLHDDFNTQIQTALHELEVNYNNIAKNAHDSATAAQREIDAVRANNNNLADTIQSILNNIKANNIVTRPEYDKLANEIVNRLSQINTKPDYYDNYNDMIAANPNGTQDLCVTADNQHKWLFVNGSWLDLGEFSYADIAPALKNSLYSQDHENVLVNPDMRDGAYGWNIEDPWVSNPDNNIGNSQSYGIYVQNEPPQGKDYEIFQSPIPVHKHKVLSAGVKVTTNGAENAYIQVIFRDANDNIIMDAISKAPIPQNLATWTTVKLENVSIPANAVSTAFTIAMQGKGVLNICQPVVNFEPYLLPYSIKEVREQLSYNQDNALLNPDMRYCGYGWNIQAPWVLNTDNNIGNSQSYGIYVQEEPPQGKDYEIYQNPIPVYRRKVLSAGVKVMTNNAESAIIQVHFVDTNNNIINNAVYRKTIPQNISVWQTIKLENISIPDNAAVAVFIIAMRGKGVLNICQPVVNFEPYLLPYSIKEVREQLSYNQDNALLNPDMRYGGYGWNIEAPWVANSDNNIDNSQSYGIYVQEEPQGRNYRIYQTPIPVYKHKVLSAGVKVTANGAESATIQILFRDANDNIIDNAAYTAPIPQNISDWQTVKLENISIPANAVSVAFTIAMNGKGTLNICQPVVNFEPYLLPYSIKKASEHKLPYFVFDTDSANVTDKWITAPFTYDDGIRELQGYAQISIQGDSSRGYPKKNYKIKLFSDSDCKQKMKVKMKTNWASLANFNLKANWIDATQSRNLVGAKLMADATAVTPFQDDKVAENLSKSQAYGQMEGFPIEVWFGTDYHGLYSCNTKKADSSFGMDKDTKGTAVISVLDNVNNPSSQTLRIPTAKLDNVAYADELHDTPDPDLVTNWSAWLDFVNNSSDTDFKAKLSNYIDINSAINLYLFGVMSREYDYESKSVLYLTWDNGKSYYLVAYDLDSNWGQNVSGVIEGNPQDDKWGFSTETASHKDGSFVDNAGMNKLFERMFKLFKSEIKQQYQYLRKTVWRNDQIIRSYKDYLEKIPEALLEKDEAKWSQIPSVKDNNFEQLHQIITQRCNQMDKWIDQLVPPVQPTGTTTTDGK